MKEIFIIFICIINLNAQIFHFKKGWNLIGAGENIVNLDFFNKYVKIVWKYENGKWLVWPYKSNIYKEIKVIKKFEGFWAFADEDCIVDNKTVSVSNEEQLSKAIENNYSKIILSNDIYLSKPIEIFNKQGIVIDGKFHKLIGGKTVNNWIYVGKGIYKTQASNIKYVPNILYEKDKSIVKAREPNKGYFFTQGPDKNDTKYSFIYDINFTDNIKNLEVYIWSGDDPSWNWFVDIAGVKSKQGNIFYLEDSTRYKIAKGSRFYFQNLKEFLDSKGEFYFDSITNILYVIPFNDINNVYIPTTFQLMFIKNSKNITVKNTIFKYTNMSDRVNFKDIRDFIKNGFSKEEYDDEKGAIEIINSKNIIIKNNIIKNTGLHGIKIGENSKFIKLIDNNVSNIGYTGILINGGWKFESNTSNNIVYHNNISNFGKTVGHGAGIQIIQSGENNISNNFIKNGSRYGISLKSVIKKSILNKKLPDYCGGEIIDKNSLDWYLKTNNNLIYENNITNVNLDSSDTGIIESWGYNRKNEIIGNYLFKSSSIGIHNGIYLDDDSYGFNVKNNIIDDLNSTYLHSVFFIKGDNHIIKNNIIKNIKYACGIFSLLGDQKNVIISNNKVINSTSNILNIIYPNSNYIKIILNNFFENIYNAFYLTKGFKCESY